MTTLSHRRGKWLKRVGAGLLLGLLLALLAGRLAIRARQSQYRAPGQLVDVGGYRLHLLCQGSGQPTVVMEAGMGVSSLTWSHVWPAVAPLTQVCVYDRAGLGWSEPSPRPRLSSEMVDELHTLLGNAGIDPPYLLVGHSMGGMLLRHYAYLYPEEVAGMVLVDAQHEALARRTPPAVVEAEEKLSDSTKRQVALIKGLIATGVLALFPSLVPSDARLPAEAQAAEQAINVTSVSAVETALAEWLASKESQAQVMGLSIRDLGGIPVRVLVRGKADPLPADVQVPPEAMREAEAIHQALQVELAALSPNSQLIVAEQSGHYIQLDQPELVIAAIQELLAELEP